MTDVRLIIGPPGTGKTTALAEETERAAAKDGPSSVAICSLTRTAAAEIAARTEVPDDNVGTLHSAAFHALDRPDLAETPEGIRAWNADNPTLRLSGGVAALDDVDGGEALGERDTSTADQLHQAVMNRRARMQPVDQWSGVELDFYDQWRDWKRETDRLDFTDLIERAIEGVDFHPAGPRTLLGDETQDFSTLELALFRKWARGAQTAIIAADPDQSIYGWRGADPHAFDRIDDQHTRILGQSYRVPRAVHAAATGWISQIERRRQAPYAPRDEHGDVRVSNFSLSYPEPLVADIGEELAGGGTAMLLTSCGYMLAPALKALRAAGVPFHNPLRPKKGAWNPMRGARRLAAFLRPDERVWGERARSWTWSDLKAWTEPLSARSAMARGGKALIEAKCVEDRFGESQASQDVPLEALAEIFGDPTFQHPAFRSNVEWWEKNLLASKREAMAYPLSVLRSRGGAALLERPRLVVGTIHSTKGSEADSVFLAPDLSRAAMWNGWRVGGAPREHIVRTFYVGATRARQSLTVLAPSGPERVPVDALVGGQREAVAA